MFVRKYTLALLLLFVLISFVHAERNQKLRRVRKRKQMFKASRPDSYAENRNFNVAEDKNLWKTEKKISKLESSTIPVLRRKIKLRKKKNPTGPVKPVNPAFVVSPTQNQGNFKNPQQVEFKYMPHILPPKKILPFIPTAAPLLMQSQETANNRTKDEKRFLSLFTIVKFQNEPCIAGSGNNGTCYSKSDCDRMGGISSGNCAQGFGVCCLFSKTCGESTNTNNTYFQNEGFPSTFDNVGSCQLTVTKASRGVCQLRLDFDSMVLTNPDPINHVCTNDQFLVSGGFPVPVICGTNSGLHMYVDMGLSTNSDIVLTTVTRGPPFSRMFSVKVTQIHCSSLNKASDGCLQYYTSVTGQIKSFNWNDGDALQLSNTDYAICIRAERNFCGIQYTACPASMDQPSNSFSISNTPTPISSRVGSSCTQDWITIPCATSSTVATESCPIDRICGMVFSANEGTEEEAVHSFSKPFIVRVHTDDLEGTPTPDRELDTSNRGFCLNFVQQPCTGN